MADLEMKYQNEKSRPRYWNWKKPTCRKTSTSRSGQTEECLPVHRYRHHSPDLICFSLFQAKDGEGQDHCTAADQAAGGGKKLLAAQSLVEGQEEERKRIAGNCMTALECAFHHKNAFSAIRDKSPEKPAAHRKSNQIAEQAPAM